ncbi:two-component system sensor histidine kinase NtrB [Marinibactrum halimedae]|uniref:histidine kinase n=1 Tax=Marinibactrum halimedae TaxID=1444977 RepID=A0AA37T745_9GAMM|nr:ATP-binding protein [Marinibactrum halimedae]MCD9459515.1 ATP-binding protein [Marinibactrum halimedae]GLS28169.1 hypothetical protein GCM10007877_38880 [Marinibactrum halimedae]
MSTPLASLTATAAISLTTLPTFCLASPLSNNALSQTEWLLSGVTTLLLITLLLSKAQHEKRQSALLRDQHQLEDRVSKRTETLNDLNEKLSNEIVQHKATEALLKKTQAYYHSIIHSMPSIIIGLAEDGTITHWNNAAVLSTAISEKDAVGQTIDNMYPYLNIKPEILKAALGGDDPMSFECLAQGHGSHRRYVDLTIYPLKGDHNGAVVRIDDVTQKVQVENMMVQNEKLMSLGEMAAGLAHEINNPLAAVINSIQNIERRTSLSLPANRNIAEQCNLDLENLQHYFEQRGVKRSIETLREGAERAALIVKNMLDFSHGGAESRGPEAINQLIEHAVELAKRGFETGESKEAHSSNLILELKAEQDICLCAPTEIQQVILNLIRNGCQACEEAGIPPEITLTTRTELDQLIIDIKDNGPGIPDDVISHIFEPFFTTKGVGQGTGLGLSVSYFIITEHHDGTIEVESHEGEGTCFSIHLPLLEDG